MEVVLAFGYFFMVGLGFGQAHQYRKMTPEQKAAYKEQYKDSNPHADLRGPSIVHKG